MKSIVLLSSKPWNKNIHNRLNKIIDCNVHLIQKEDCFNYEAIKIINQNEFWVSSESEEQKTPSLFCIKIESE